MKISETLISIANEIAVDEAKFEKGNSSAGTRIRASLMKAKKFADTARREIQEKKNAA